MTIDRITVTGADDSIDVSELARLSEKYPKIEFGILLSSKSMGQRRFPSRQWLSSLKSLPGTVKLSGHLCGAWVRDTLMGEWPQGELEEILGVDPFERFDRWQLNTHGIRHKWSTDFLKTLHEGPRVIFQNDDKHMDLIRAARDTGFAVAALFDLSHGAGLLPSEWPKPLDGVYCGYAGGLSPENVAEQCIKLSQIVTGNTWIDAETKLRTPDDAVFDLDRVERFVASALGEKEAK